MTTQPAWVLVVDDDVSDRMALFRLLEGAGHRATVVDNDQSALELLRAEPFDVVLLADADGYAVLKTMPRVARPFDPISLRSTVDAVLEDSSANRQ